MGHGYEVPADALPILDTYVQRGMSFVALRLRPGVGVSLMQPVRIRVPGLALTLPLQRVAIGAGTTVDLELFVFAEGRMEAATFPNAEVDRADAGTGSTRSDGGRIRAPASNTPRGCRCSHTSGGATPWALALVLITALRLRAPARGTRHASGA